MQKRKKIIISSFFITILLLCIGIGVFSSGILDSKPSSNSNSSLIKKGKKHPKNKKEKIFSITNDPAPIPPISESTSKIRLNLPQSVQENSYFCVPSCLQMVL